MTKSRGMREHHGLRSLPEYAVWTSMRSRCNNYRDPAWQNYGGRGIAVCPRWGKFSSFYADMGSRPEGWTLERIDNDLGYSPDNCKWAPRIEQSRNRRSVLAVTLDGETHPLSVWVERLGLKYATVHQRLTKYGWSVEQALRTPKVTHRSGIPRGQKIMAWGAENGVSFHEPESEAA